MSGFSDYQDDMTTNRTLDERTIEALLAGRALYDREDLTPLASLMMELRAVGDGIPPEPNAALAGVLAHGLPADPTTADDDLPVPAGGQIVRPAKQASGLPTWKRVRTMISGFVSAFAAKVAALGVVAKASLAVTATAAVAAGAVAADVPQTVSNSLGGGAHVPASIEAGDAGLEASADASADADADADVSDIEVPEASDVVEGADEQVDTLEGTIMNSPAGGPASDAVGQAGKAIGDVEEQVPDDVTDAVDDARGQVPDDVTDGVDDVRGQVPVPAEVDGAAERVQKRIPSQVSDTAGGLLP
ncbi:MAG: hypothetical protein GEU81_04120 [Nitriliruptorales bacterium]|nr:hypothetical protein [Nitriliruptorales bacterium]